MWTTSALRLTVCKYRRFLLSAKRGLKTNKPKPDDFDKFNPVDLLARFMRGSLEIAGLKKVGPLDREKLQKKRFAVMVMGLVLFVAVWEEIARPGRW